MKFKQKEITTKDDDKLSRRDEIEPLTNLILNVEDNLVLAIDGKWGSGKTAFVNLWQEHLKEKGLDSLIINAWETDYAKDPLIVILNQLNKWAENLNDNEKNKKIKTTFKKIKKIIAPLLYESLKSSIKLITLDSVDVDKINEIIKFNEAYTNKELEQFQISQNAIEEFKNLLVDLRLELGKNLIIFIDELDRCKPTYAIELLERIKHIFGVDGVVFVLSIDKVQLSNSIKSVYGNYFDSTSYLNRFIDITYNLNSDKNKKYCEILIEDLSNELQEKQLNDAIIYAKDLLLSIVEYEDLSLRDFNQMIIDLKIIFLSNKKEDFYSLHLVFLLVFLKRNNFSLYNKIFIDQNSVNEVISYLNKVNVVNKINNINEDYISIIKGNLIALWFENSLDKKNIEFINKETEKNYNDVIRGFNEMHQYFTKKGCIDLNCNGKTLKKIIEITNSISN